MDGQANKCCAVNSSCIIYIIKSTISFIYALMSQPFDFYLRKVANRIGGSLSFRKQLARPAEPANSRHKNEFRLTPFGFKLTRIFYVEVFNLLRLG